MNIFYRQVQEAAEAAVILSPTSFAWFGSPSRPLTVSETPIDPETARAYLLFALQNRLYADFYTRGRATPESSAAAAQPRRQGMTPFVAALSAANAGTGHWESGWAVLSVANQRVTVQKDGLAVTVTPDRCSGKGPLTAGARVRMRTGKEHLGISPGFYMSYGNAELAVKPGEPLVRLYWHLTPEGAVPLMRALTTALNHAGLPFQFKVVNDPQAFTRCDAGVLYCPGGRYDAVIKQVEQLYPEVAPWLRAATPAFSKPLAPGLGLAEDPGVANTSFGMHRCRLLAEGLVGAYEAGRTSLADRTEFVAAYMEQNGAPLSAPYLNPGARDRYHFTPKTAAAPRPEAPAFAAAPPDPAECLQVAARLGQRLNDLAIWHEDRCNWMGPSLTADEVRTYEALGPDLYAGSSGIGWFLAELAALTGDRDTRRTALGAMRHALSRCEDAFPNVYGLYMGQVGAAGAALYAARILDSDELWERGRRIALRCRNPQTPQTEFDLLSGSAGGIIGAIWLRHLLDEPALLDWASDLADALIGSARLQGDSFSWPSPQLPEHRHLTGFSHGTAGIGYALMELYGLTGDLRYHQAAAMAFAYERRWFDPQAQNWPDFRMEPAGSEGDGRPRPCRTFWCHGSAGIALSRLRAFAITGDERCKAEALTGLETTRRMAEALLSVETADFTLCHGLAGNAEVLRYGARVLGAEWADGASLPARVARKGLDLYGAGKLPWPCGIDDRQAPGLFIGLAGIGRFYLRLHDETLPSLLLPGTAMDGRSVTAKSDPAPVPS